MAQFHRMHFLCLKKILLIKPNFLISLQFCRQIFAQRSSKVKISNLKSNFKQTSLTNKIPETHSHRVVYLRARLNAFQICKTCLFRHQICLGYDAHFLPF